MFRLPPLQNIQQSITTEHSFGEGGVSYCNLERVGRSEYPRPATDKELSYGRPHPKPLLWA